jgi:uncharacterized membrane protein YqaE (UPF0057 family)
MKPGYQTSEFWLSLLAMIMPALQTLIDTAPAAGWIPALIAAIYTASRAYTKKQA